MILNIMCKVAAAHCYCSYCTTMSHHVHLCCNL